MNHVVTDAGLPQRYLPQRFLTRYGALLLTAIISLGSPQTHATDVYHWIDDNGVQSFGERPPEGVDYVKLKLNGGSTKARSSLPPPFPPKQRTKPAPKRPQKTTDSNTAKKIMP